ncbi:MAG: carboxypeptidase-like regulatory domain-containing protein, partial [Bryobacterales bacterium]|nr:carboxypeptidase-like regulatory domain-containing protein [Bryobacterales bacterium]
MNRTSGTLRARLTLGFLAVVILSSGSAWAQVAPTASLAGTVTDSSGAVVPAASVTVTNSGTQFTRTSTTGENGRFLLTLLPIGSYSLEASAPGFATFQQTGITLNVDTTHSLTVEL